MARTHHLKAALLAALLVLLLVAGCASIKVTTDHDAYTDFSQLRSYSWAPKVATSSDPRVENDLLGSRVRRAVDRELRMAGYERVDESPDFWVTYQNVVDSKLDSHSYYGAGFGRRSYGSGLGAGVVTDVREVEVGSLMVDVLAGEEQELVWRGTAMARIRDDQSPAERTERVNEAVGKILSQFPPET